MMNGSVLARISGLALKTLKGILALALLLIFMLILIRGCMEDSPTELKQIEVIPKGKSKDLAVLLHSYRGPTDLKSLSEVVSKELPDADILMPDYSRGLFTFFDRPLSNDDPFNIATQLNDRLEELYQESLRKKSEYNRIYLIGHGIGALLARKAFVYGHGITEDAPVIDSQHKNQWVDKVDRIILLAGMNRGWTLSPTPPHMPWHKKFRFWIYSTLAQWTGTGEFIRSVERGMPFVANLRLQWIKLAKVNEGKNLPPVFQLLGDYDNIVTSEDNADLMTSANFTYVPVYATGHADVKEFNDSYYGTQRREKFRAALSEDIRVLQTRYGINKLQPDPGITDVVFVLHGIRTYGDWTHELSKRLQERAKEHTATVQVVTASYGYFPLLPFLFGDRQENVKWFVDQYTEQQARFPQARISFIGHSNGTYIAAKALEDYKMITLRRVVFAGSVVPRHYPWDLIVQRDKQVEALRNDLAAGDFVVGVGPGFFESMHEIFKWGKSSIGTGGFRGFLDNSAQIYETRYFKGVHSPAIECSSSDDAAMKACETQYKSLADFVLVRSLRDYHHPKLQELGPLVQSRVNWWADTISQFSWAVFPILLILMVLIWKILEVAMRCTIRKAGKKYLSSSWKSPFLTGGISLLVIWLLLNTF